MKIIFCLILVIILLIIVFDPAVDVTEDDSVIIWYTNFSGDRKYLKF